MKNCHGLIEKQASYLFNYQADALANQNRVTEPYQCILLLIKSVQKYLPSTAWLKSLIELITVMLTLLNVIAGSYILW